VTPAIKRQRYRRLMRVAQEVSLARNREWVGRELTVLVESGTRAQGAPDGRRAKSGDVFAGRSYRDAPEVDGLVLGPGRPPAGSMVRVRVKRALPYDLWGSVVAT
jgi:ribosomal protein S12 methylthiotransferase